MTDDERRRVLANIGQIEEGLAGIELEDEQQDLVLTALTSLVFMATEEGEKYYA